MTSDSRHKQYICLNGHMLPADEPSLLHTNRAFCYGDALFETIHGNGTSLQFFDDHYSRLEKGMLLLGMEKDNLPDASLLEAVIIKLLNKNHIYKGVRIRLSVFRDQGGYYTPARNSCSYLIDTCPLPHDHYVLNDKGLKMILFTSMLKQKDILAGLKTSNSLIFVLAGLSRYKHGADDCFILNTEGRLAESISSNVFLVKKGIIFTPPLSEGCVEGIMRNQILRIATEAGIRYEEIPLGEKELLEAEECFLTNSVAGIRWVGAYGQRRYYSRFARRMNLLLNNDCFGRIQ